MTTAAWWDKLPADFFAQDDGTPLDERHPIKIGATAAADRVLRTFLSSAIVGSSVPNLARPSQMARERERLEAYHALASTRDIDSIFPTPGVADIVASKPRFLHYRPRGIPAVDLSFDSVYEPLLPEMRASYLAHPRNRRVWAQHWRHPSGPRKTLIFLHGVIEGWYGLNSNWFALKWFYRQGYDVLQMTLPFHGYRTERYHPFSGYGFFSGGFCRINEAMLQAVCDARVLIRHLREQGAPSVGIAGLSLGGYLSALTATVERDMAFCIPNSPVVSPIDMARAWQPSGMMLEVLQRLYGLDLLELRRGMAVHSPLTYQPRTEGRRVMIIGGAGDRLTPPRFLRLLHAHWPGSHMHWFPGNHVLHLGQRKYLKLMSWFMNGHS